jgi:predicted DNA-binding transcriptional regulator AlpA
MSETTTKPAPKKERLLDIDETKRRTGESDSSIYRGMNRRTFPQSVAVSANKRRWVESEVDEWVWEKIRARDFGLDADLRLINQNIGRGGKPKAATAEQPAPDPGQKIRRLEGPSAAT